LQKLHFTIFPGCLQLKNKQTNKQTNKKSIHGLVALRQGTEDLENVEKFQSQYVGMVCSTDKNVTVFGIRVTVFYMATILQQLLPT